MKKDCLCGFQSSKFQATTIKVQAKADKTGIKSLMRELRYIEKALAEPAALLVLRKKLSALWGPTETLLSKIKYSSIYPQNNGQTGILIVSDDSYKKAVR